MMELSEAGECTLRRCCKDFWHEPQRQ